MVLSRRRMQAAMNATPMEQAAYIGLLALAVSDALYCISALLAAVQSREQSAFHHDELVRMYAQLYGPYLTVGCCQLLVLALDSLVPVLVLEVNVLSFSLPQRRCELSSRE